MKSEMHFQRASFFFKKKTFIRKLLSETFIRKSVCSERTCTTFRLS